MSLTFSKYNPNQIELIASLPPSTANAVCVSPKSRSPNSDLTGSLTSWRTRTYKMPKASRQNSKANCGCDYKQIDDTIKEDWDLFDFGLPNPLPPNVIDPECDDSSLVYSSASILIRR
jgi:hypothetical protein